MSDVNEGLELMTDYDPTAFSEQPGMYIPVVLDKGATMPHKKPGDAGWDLHANLEPGTVIPIQPGRVANVPTGVRMNLGKEVSQVCGIIKTRSSYAAKGIVVVGGVIDSTYRGEIMVMLHNTTRRPFYVENCNKIAQILFFLTVSANMVEVEKLEDSERGEGGFGSTGE